MKIIFSVLVIMGISIKAQAASNEKIVYFVNQMVEKRGLFGCKKVISHIFKSNVDAARANTWVIPGEKNAVKVVVTFGKKGDSLVYDIFLRKNKNKCLASVTGTFTSSKSCISELSRSKGYTLTAECADFMWFNHKNGATMHMKPMGNGCIVTIISDFHSDIATKSP